MNSLCQRLVLVQNRIAEAAQRYGRDPDSVSLLAVSKTQNIERLKLLVECGQRRFGENYLQEAVKKISTLSDYPLEWHFIGAIQANKTRKIAQLFSWVHSVDRYRIAARLSQQRPRTLPPLNICLQVNINREPGKAGIFPGMLVELADQVVELPFLKLRGLMAIPRTTANPRVQHENFGILREIRQTLNSRGHKVDTLSMGMSNDMESAIAEGATIVRIGTAIFGPRDVSP
jgi:pyridoxal phosphate enzyme (YggS family)